MSAPLRHVTLQTGHELGVARAAVPGEALAVLAPVLREARAGRVPASETTEER